MHNFRPIEINSTFGNILGKLLKNRIHYHVVERNLLPTNEFGFKHRTFATLALNCLKQSIKRQLENKRKLLSISLDIKNAFNLINKDVFAPLVRKVKVPRNMQRGIINTLSNKVIRYEYVN